MERKCYRCKVTKPLSDFYKDKRRKQGHHYECKECTKARVTATRDPERARDLHLQRTYGITLDTFNGMVSTQSSRCACCGSSEPGGKHNQWCVDHDHVTNKVRELLCKDCNIVLGIVSDSPTHLKKLIQYIAKHND